MEQSGLPGFDDSPAEFPWQSHWEAIWPKIAAKGLDRGEVRPGTLLPRFLRRNRRSGVLKVFSWWIWLVSDFKIGAIDEFAGRFFPNQGAPSNRTLPGRTLSW
jgi:hypothetical protein